MILAVPNPCLPRSQQQFHPFAFSRRAYINCDDERIFFQPCNANLYWNQEDKRCDRVLPLLLRAPFLNLRNQNQPNQWPIRRGEEQDFTTPTPNVIHQQFVPLPQTVQNSRPIPNRFIETTTAATRMFHLEGLFIRNTVCLSLIESYPGFSSDNFEQQNIASDIIPQLPRPTQRNNQFGFVQARQSITISIPLFFVSSHFLDEPAQQPEWQNNQVFQDDQSRDTTNEFNRPIQTQSGILLPIKAS